ncbi:tripartite tricarboxylate transporter substrate binding protein [Hydrogenophaga sp. BPS33]|uniref:tripartite tricarboxylate transporter substrate binding protein n=1 Tax=Hydrogenophaga sp. BPS33 TaxID=2651974 RepID=UPI0013567A37|nr:tripartite tricarboxylate transporter substrate binding protein [Hydrogenophaga sp. BPS33]
MNSVFRLLSGCVAGALSLTFAVAVQAQAAFPNKTITIIVPYTAGGTTDLLARSVADVLRAQGGQTVVVDNKPGAGGSIAGKMVVNANPDGYTLLMTSSGINSVTPVVYKDFNALDGLAQVSVLVDVPFVVSVHKKFAAQNLKDFVAYAKKKPDDIRIGNASKGSHGHLTQLLFDKAAGVQLLSVPYKGSVPSLNDLLGGHIEATIDNVGVIKPYIDTDKLTALFVTSKNRSPALPQVPTATELGVPFDSTAWFGLAAPRNTPPAIVKQIRDMVAKGFEDKAQQDKLVQAGLTPVFGTPAEATARTKAESASLGKLAETLSLSQN